MCTAFVYSWAIEGSCKPPSASRHWGQCPWKNFSAYAYKIEIYVKHVLLDISIKGQFKSTKCLLHSSNQKLLLLFKKCFSLHFYKKRSSKKIFSKSVTIIGYKDNLKPLSLFDGCYFLAEPL